MSAQSTEKRDQAPASEDQELWNSTNEMMRGRIAPHNVLLSHMIARSPLMKEIGTVLEIGCGSGQFSFFMHRSKCKVTLIDASKEAITCCRAMFNGHTENVQFVLEDVLTYKPEERFDLVYSGGLLEHYKGGFLRQMFEAHVRASAKYVMVAVPADTPRNWSRAIRNRNKTSREGALPDWTPMGEAQLLELFQELGIEVVLLCRIDETYGRTGVFSKLRRELIRRRFQICRSIDTNSGGLVVGIGRITPSSSKE